MNDLDNLVIDPVDGLIVKLSGEYIAIQNETRGDTDAVVYVHRTHWPAVCAYVKKCLAQGGGK